MAAEDPRAGSNMADEINDPVFKAETRGAIAINADDPYIASDIASDYIDPTITDTNGNPIRDTTLSQIALKPTDPRLGADMADGILTPEIKADTLSAIAINADDPYIASDIAHRIDPTITDTNGNPIRDSTLARVALNARDSEVGRHLADYISTAGIRADTVKAIESAAKDERHGGRGENEA